MIFFKTNLSFKALADRLRKTLNIPDKNHSGLIEEQMRYSLSVGGGDYFLFESLGLEFYLIRNEGEVEIEEKEGWNYYLYIECPLKTPNPEWILALMEYLRDFLKTEGFWVELDCVL